MVSLLLINEYENLKKENQNLHSDIGRSRQELDEVSQRLAEAENHLKQDSLKQRA